ncbi:arsenate reductase ArsC [Microbulbifer sp. 2205BS26-8]|uniref:arsenate reductase ArsC n=1 Tax=Microbulbifer sp. 2205BS26-8 TaxID=3064386 RepID=UPI00273FDA79|nr:arsenate reductase ArsC [Microbulbifer sp. 2205BS26-8]MDP5209381.1 arsenate reductase ArsC [Microbulbifer sp. 2205BS26-8]
MKSILVLCTGNSCRSIMAEALINTLAEEKYIAKSAGSEPVGFVHPKSIEVLKQHGIDTKDLHSKLWDEFQGMHFDVVISVCDQNDSKLCPLFFGKHKKLNWNTPDPDKKEGTGDEIKAAFKDTFNFLKSKIEEELL